jgi:hypothetical protein
LGVECGVERDVEDTWDAWGDTAEGWSAGVVVQVGTDAREVYDCGDADFVESGFGANAT